MEHIIYCCRCKIAELATVNLEINETYPGDEYFSFLCNQCIEEIQLEKEQAQENA